MKICIISPDASGQCDNMVKTGLLDFLPNVVDSEASADVLIIPISYLHVFKFSEQLLGLTKRWILMDFTEFGWDAAFKDNMWGHGITSQFAHLNTPDYARFDDWVRDNPPILTFKRDLLLLNATPTVLPVEWPCQMPALPMPTKEEFDARPLEVFFNWGLSHPSRPMLHGSIFQNAHAHGIHVIDSWKQDRWEKRNWATIHSPHYLRQHINEVMKWNRRAKLSVSLWGAGWKCFRHTMESPVSSIMALPHDELAWSYPWEHGVNCILLDTTSGADMFNDLEQATRRDDLWEIYRAGQDTVEKHRSVPYCRYYIMPAIEAIL